MWSALMLFPPSPSLPLHYIQFLFGKKQPPWGYLALALNRQNDMGIKHIRMKSKLKIGEGQYFLPELYSQSLCHKLPTHHDPSPALRIFCLYKTLLSLRGQASA